MIAKYSADRDDARGRLIASHRYLCTKGARRFVRPGLERCDLEQVAAIGLIKATDRYDPAHGTPFEPFAWVFVLGELMHYVRDHERVIRAPRRLRDADRRWHCAHDVLVRELGREPTRREIRRRAGFTESDERELFLYRQRASVESFDVLLHDGGLRYETHADRVAMRLELDAALATLSHNERLVIRGLYHAQMTTSELSGRLKYSTRHITRLHRAALKKLNDHFVRDERSTGTV